LLILALVPVLFAARQLQAAPQEEQQVYLPVIMDNFKGFTTDGIFGKVTDDKKTAGNVQLDLRRYNGGPQTTESETTTDGQGGYLFTDAPTLPAGYSYYVRFGPNETQPAHLFVWFGPDIDSYTAGATTPGGDFDISNVPLLKPVDGATVAVPFEFCWERRGIPGDDYVVELFDYESDQSWVTANQGNKECTTINNLPGNIQYGKTYGWQLLVYKGDDSYGISYGVHDITFSKNLAQGEVEGGAAQQWRGAEEAHGRDHSRR